MRLRDQKDGHDAREVEAFAPYIIIVVVFAIAKLVDPVEQFLFEFGGGTGFGTDEKTPNGFAWPGLDVVDADGEAPSAADVPVLVLGHAGHGRAVLRPADDRRAADQLRATRCATYGATLDQLKLAIVTVDGGPRARLRDEPDRHDDHARPLDRRAPASFFAFLSPIIGWLGVAITGSDTSSNALFGALQVEAAKEAGLSDVLLASANSSGGVLGKMISPQNLAIGAAAVALAGKEGDIFRRVLFWSIGLTLVMCVIVYLQSTAILDWMVVEAK